MLADMLSIASRTVSSMFANPQLTAHNVGSAAKPLAKDAMEQALPDLVNFLLTHPDVKSMKQVCAASSCQWLLHVMTSVAVTFRVRSVLPLLATIAAECITVWLC